MPGNELDTPDKNGPYWEKVRLVPTERKIPETILHMGVCSSCTLGTMACAATFIIGLFGFVMMRWYPASPYIFVILTLIAMVSTFLHARNHLHTEKAELTGLGSSCQLPIDVVDRIEQWLVTHPIKVGAIDTPWKDVKTMKDQSRSRLVASLAIPVECRTMFNGVSPILDRELNLTVDAHRAEVGTDIKVSMEFTAINQKQSEKTIAAVCSGIVIAVVMQEVIQIGSRTPIRWFFPEPIYSRDGTKFLVRVKGTLVMEQVDEGRIETKLMHALRQVQSEIDRAASEMNADVLRSDPVTLKATAAARISDNKLLQGCRFELEEIQLEEVGNNLPAVLGLS